MKRVQLGLLLVVTCVGDGFELIEPLTELVELDPPPNDGLDELAARAGTDG